jgi:hypothetical protein
MEPTRAIQKLERSNPAIFDQAFQNLAELQKLSMFLLDSGMCPEHFYEKGPDGKVDRQKGKVAALGMTLLHGNDLGLPPMTAMQWIVQVNGLMSIKGDGAKALIYSSGKLEKDSLKMEFEGSIETQDYKVAITAQRSDNKEKLTRSFSVMDAKRAGLWVTDQQINSKDGWKYRKSSWYKYPERMVYYRALGFLARDLFSDVLYGTYTTEEAMDIPQEAIVVIETPAGQEIIIPDKDFNNDRSKKLTGDAVGQIDKKKQYPITPEEAHPAPTGNLSGTAKPVGALKDILGSKDKARELVLRNTPTEDLKRMIHQDTLMLRTLNMMPGKNSNKKLRTIILAHEAGQIVSLLASHDPTAFPDLSDASTVAKMPPIGADLNPELAEKPVDGNTNHEVEVPTEAPRPEPDFTPRPGDVYEIVDEAQIDVPEGPEIEVPELQEDGKRDFHDMKTLYEELSNVVGIDSKRFMHLVETKLPEFAEFKDKDNFCLRATEDQVIALIRAI